MPLVIQAWLIFLFDFSLGPSTRQGQQGEAGVADRLVDSSCSRGAKGDEEVDYTVHSFLID